MEPHVEFAVRAINSYVLLFPDEPAVIRLKEALADLESATEGFFSAD